MTISDRKVAFVGISGLLKEGLVSLVQEALGKINLLEYADISSLFEHGKSNELNVVFINASMLFASVKILNIIRKTNPNAVIIAIQYQFVTAEYLNICDEIITIDQNSVDIIAIIKKAISTLQAVEPEGRSEQLSDRETEVMKLLVKGYASKEIADKLNISINTVISHRKNISQKTGIKSIAGLAIFAVANKYISMK